MTDREPQAEEKPDKRHIQEASQMAIVVKHLSANTGDTGDADSIPGLRRSPGLGNGYPLQYSCLDNSMERGAWEATIHGVAKNWTRLSN